MRRIRYYKKESRVAREDTSFTYSPWVHLKPALRSAILYLVGQHITRDELIHALDITEKQYVHIAKLGGFSFPRRLNAVRIERDHLMLN